MDLIYMNANKEDVGVLLDYTFDLAFGSNENDFECKIVQESHCCEEDFILYIEGTEYGGIIDDIGIDTDADEITYHGRTWHGVLNSKVLEPDSGADYLIVSGEANGVLSDLIGRMGLSDFFVASSEHSGIIISSYKMNRYITGYDGIKKMLASAGAKLNIRFSGGFAVLSAKPIIDYSKDEEFNKDQIDFKVVKKSNRLNHVICLGQGDLAEREVIHVYTDENGNISSTQVLFGLDEVSATYENVNAADSTELCQGGIDLLKEAWEADELEFDFTSDDSRTYDIGDIVGATEETTGVTVTRDITKKIVQIKGNEITISYECGDKGTATYEGSGVTGGGSGGSGGGGGSQIEMIPLSNLQIEALLT